MNQEVIEYMQLRNRQQTVAIGSLIPWAAGFISLALGTAMQEWHLLAGGVVMWASSIALLTICHAVDTDGYCRAFWSLFKEFDAPPLDSWKSDLQTNELFEGGESA